MVHVLQERDEVLSRSSNSSTLPLFLITTGQYTFDDPNVIDIKVQIYFQWCFISCLSINFNDQHFRCSPYIMVHYKFLGRLALIAIFLGCQCRFEMRNKRRIHILLIFLSHKFFNYCYNFGIARNVAWFAVEFHELEHGQTLEDFGLFYWRRGRVRNLEILSLMD